MTDQAKTRSALHRRAVLAAAMLAAGLSNGLGRAAAFEAPAAVGLSVVDRETGTELPFWRQGGRPFVAGEPGRRYGLRVVNRTGGRVLLVLSVDGVNVFSGETAGYDQRGYVLDPHESYEVNGWRKSTSEIAAFTFAPLSGSYAARTGRPADVGVIGMAVFRERPPPSSVAEDATPRRSMRGRRSVAPPVMDAPPPLSLPPTPAPVRPSEAPASSASVALARDKAMGEVARATALRPDEKLGTAHGAREWSSVTMVSFERESPSPQSVRRIEYDTAAHLLARGVMPPYPGARPPRAFPLQPGGGFVPDPPGGR